MGSQAKFYGKGGEYFGIWIVNILLTIITLGIYSAWAHVRTKRYFYGNTELAGDRFEFLATPKQILIGRIIALALLVVYIVTSKISPTLALILLIVFFLSMPWIAQRSLRFNAQMSRYRGVRFDFTGSIGDAYYVFFGRPILAYLALFGIFMILVFLAVNLFGGSLRTSMPVFLPFVFFLLTLPLMAYLSAWISKGVTSYIHNGYRYGSEQFNAQLSSNVFFKTSIIAYLIAFAIMLVPSIIGSSVLTMFIHPQEMSRAPTPGIVFGAIALYLVLIFAVLVASAYYTSKMRNYTYDNTYIGNDRQYRFGSTMQTMPYTVLVATNFLMVLFSLGLLIPFAHIRHSKYMVDVTQVHGDLNALNTKELTMSKTSAVGDSLANNFDVNISF